MDLDTNINSLPIDLIYIKLQRDTLIIEGKGTIYNKNNDSLAVKIYIIASENFDPVKYFSELLTANQKAGQIISDSIFFKFAGKSSIGDEYSCDKSILVDTINSEIINVELKDYLFISNDNDFKEYKLGKVIIPFEITLPYNRSLEINRKYSDKWSTRSFALKLFETNVNDIDIDILADQGKTIIFFQTKSRNFSDLNDIYPIIDALGFLSSTVIDKYDVEFASHKNGISKKILCPSFLKEPIVKMNYPPLHFNLSAETSNNYCDLYNNFYLFRIQDKSSELAYVLRQVTGSVNYYISTFALTLTTSIELLAKAYFAEYAKEISSDIVVGAREKIEDIDINKQIKERILGLLNSIVGQIRAKDILVELCNCGIINKKEYSSWTKLRNASTHGDKNEKPFQDYYDLCSSNLMLFYKMIFYIIDYHGLYTDYSEYGYPYRGLNKNAS